ncbi:8-oxo-dGTP diphosphatase [Hydrogenispora ethanolica]|jgi:8-oxo-dGTP diphosphatase|uniref:8-oxo-dGTP diphosphatase n=1 Tax=Hydrogenispora ethanolica TaxID=1082276 RepID=A0A4R1RIN5_HYDET|nr:NUDIX domain-containing protein [Hydrogenispora ethanolica]TCL65961.1 8-oxo-dGTP diphosphatase [Hydrogenispora ethanolica]
MVRLRQMAAAFLANGEDLLLMKRAETRELAPGLWAPVGGHLEPAELNDPAAACLREIWEETGIRPERLADFKLRYIISRLRGAEIRLQYIYFGRTLDRFFHPTGEGELHWIPAAQALSLEMAPTSRLLLEHYRRTGKENGAIYIGTMAAAPDGRHPLVSWAELSDWE